jgi:lipid-A-disaccharide synthase
MRILISSGEASGDTYGAQLIEVLQSKAASVEIFGAGGERMRAAGFEATVHARDISVVGIAEVISHLPKIYGEYKKLLREIDRRRPDVAVLIDFPDWNFRLAQELHRRRIPVVYYVSPQLWAWRPARIEQVKKFVTKMLVIFPFEEAWYRERGVEAEYVGHPLVDIPPPQPLAWSSAKIPVALLPGSRRKEIAMNLPTMVAAAQLLGGEYQFLLPIAFTVDPEWVAGILEDHMGSDAGRVTLERDARSVLAQSRAAMVASGTATVEAALIGTPFVMVYRVSPVTYTLGRGMVKVPFFAMPNLIAGREIVPELIQKDFTAENVVRYMREIIADGPRREKMLADFAELRHELTVSSDGTVASRVADRIFQLASQSL